MASTARPKPKTKKAKAGNAQKDHDHGLERVYTRLLPADKKRLDRAAEDDERSTMKYLERLILRHLDQIDKKKKG